MNNIEKLLSKFINLKGQKLLIKINTPVGVIKNDETINLIKNPISQKEFDYIEKEILEIFGEDKNIVFNNIKLKTSLTKNEEGIERSFFFQPSIKKKEQFILDEILNLMLEKKASDIHITSNCIPRIRKDGDIIELEEYSIISENEIKEQFQKIMIKKNIDEFQMENDTDFAYEIKEKGRFRVNLFRDHKGMGAVLRHIPQDILTIEQLDIPKAIIELCTLTKGLLLVTGPTGSGKSTTLAGIIDHINKTTSKHIITIEDPLEFIHENKKSLINQREINTHTKSFKKALRAALREDPDIVLVGEMRDLETISIAIETAVTGHLVFGTLHTSTAIGTVDRIIDQFPANQQAQIRAMLADTLLGVISQTLPKKIGGGRIGAYEVLIITNAVSNLIREAKTYQIATMMQTGKGIGMQTLNGHLRDMVNNGIVDKKEALEKSIDRKSLEALLDRSN